MHSKKKNIIAGIPLKRFYPEREKEILIAVTEMNSLDDISFLVTSLKEVIYKN